MKTTFLNYTSLPVLVVGDIMLDKYWITKNVDTLDSTLVPKLKVYNRYEYLGGAANVAKNITSVGGNSILMGVVGKDEESKIIKKALRKNKVVDKLLMSEDYVTTTKLRIISDKKQIMRLDYEKKFEKKFANLWFKEIGIALKTVSVLVLSDYDKGVLTSTSSIIKRAKENKVLTLVDPKGKNFLKYSGSTLLTPNLFEFESIVGKCFNRQDIINKGTLLLSDLKLTSLLITQSKEGMTLLQVNKKPIHYLTCADKVNDVTGAGDTVIAVIAIGLSSGYTLEESCYQANVAAGIVVQKPGTSTLTMEELEYAIKYKE